MRRFINKAKIENKTIYLFMNMQPIV